jgi:hypothetical protein
MASSLNSDNGVVSGSAGLKSSADSTGVLELQTNGTAALSISTAQVVSTTNGATIQGLTVGRGAGAIATNTAVGSGALQANTTGSISVALGYQAGYAKTTAGANVAIGHQSQYAGTTGDDNVSVGTYALYNNTGANNVAIGSVALGNAANTGSGIVAVGRDALRNNTSASNNTAVGYQAGYSNTTGASNVFLGYQAGYTQTTGGAGVGANTYLGYRAGYLATGYYNTFVGIQAGENSTGNGNTFIGSTGTYASGQSMTSGSNNTILGNFSGNNGGLDIRTASNYIVLSDGAGVPRGYFDNNGTYNITNTTGSSIPAIKITQNNSSANVYLRGIQIDQTTTGAGTNVSQGALRLTYNGGIGFDNAVESITVTATNVPGTSQNGYGRKSVTTLPASSSSTDFNNNYFQNHSSLNLNGFLSNTGATGFRTGFYANYFETITPASTNQNVYGVYINNSGTISDGYVFGFYQVGSSRNYFEGKMYMPAVYSNTVGGTNRDVFVDNNGLVGYVSSTRASKKNITSITDASWLLQLNPVAFNRRVKEDGVYTEETYSELEYGLIAEEAETVNAELCFYDDVKVEQPEGYEGEDQFNKELRGVHYNKLIVPLLKMVQELKAELDSVKSELATLKGNP